MRIRRLVVFLGLVFITSAAQYLHTGAQAEEPTSVQRRPAHQVSVDPGGSLTSDGFAAAPLAFEPNAAPPRPAGAEAAVTMGAQLRPAYQAYLAASESLASDDLAGARRAFERLVEAFEQVDTARLDEDVRSRFTTISDAISGATLKS
ncbi:MAG: hypothetical protein HYX77_03355, partial [Acidobacteria bacterium]|nr:hypothetical protein [Acidobacteriota bacterium]